MKKIFLGLLLLVSFLGFSQKVKMKKNSIFIDDIEVYKFQDEGSMKFFSTISGVEFVSIVETSYEVINPVYNSTYSSSSRYLKYYIRTIKFLKSGKELTTDIAVKQIASSIYKSEMVNENGKIDEEKLDIFINKYNNENLKYKIN